MSNRAKVATAIILYSSISIFFNGFHLGNNLFWLIFPRTGLANEEAILAHFHYEKIQELYSSILADFPKCLILETPGLMAAIFVLFLKNWARKLFIFMNLCWIVSAIWDIYGIFQMEVFGTKIGAYLMEFIIIVWNLSACLYFMRSEVREQFASCKK